MSAKPSLGAQIEEIEREIALRRGVYPRMVASGKMRQSHADEHMRRIEAVRDTLMWLKANRDAVVAAGRSSA